MNRAKKTTVMIALFAGFIVASIGIEVYREFNPMLPSRVGEGPYGVSLHQINDYSTILEGELVTFTSQLWNVSYNDSSDILNFQVKDEMHEVQFNIKFYNWSITHLDISLNGLIPGTLCAIQAISRIESSGDLEGIELYLMARNRVYILSIIGLVVIAALVLYHYKIDIKKLLLVAKKKKGGVKG